MRTRRRLRAAGLASILSLAFVADAEADAIDARNWRSHPDVVAVRALCRAIDQRIAEKTFRSQRRAYDCLPGESERVAYADEAGRIRKLVRRGGSEDSALTVEESFDEAGQLRFAFFVAGAVNGSKAELRVYFDAKGGQLWRQYDVKTGPGYTWAFDPWLTPRAPAKVDSTPALCN